MNSKKLILKLAVLALGPLRSTWRLLRQKPLPKFACLSFATPEAVVIAVMLPGKSAASAIRMTEPRYPILKSAVSFLNDSQQRLTAYTQRQPPLFDQVR
jgi:hypothetical protein